MRGPNVRRTINVGGSNTSRGGQNGGHRVVRPDSPVPTISTWVIWRSSFSNSSYHRFVRPSSPFRSPNSNDQDGPTIQGHLMAQYLMNLLSQHDFPPGFIGAPEGGRMGDYVFNQEGIILSTKRNSSVWLNFFMPALDQVITQIMEQSNANRPVPATEEIVEKLPREVLMEGCKQFTPLCCSILIHLYFSEDTRIWLCCM